MKEYKKTYWPLVLWCAALVPVMLGAIPFAEWLKLSDDAMIALMMVSVIMMLLVLFWIIWKDEYVYWINGGPSFEEAKAAGSEARREYAWKHLLAMLKGGFAALVLLAAECLMGAHELVLVLTAGICIAVAAFSTIGIKWKVNENDPEDRMS